MNKTLKSYANKMYAIDRRKGVQQTITHDLCGCVYIAVQLFSITEGKINAELHYVSYRSAR